MKEIKVMLLGIGLILMGIFCRVMGIGYSYSQFMVHFLPIVLVLAGFAALLAGLFFID